MALVGNPNVGKSVLFNALTGAYVTVSNYPGTSVEVSRGNAIIDGETWQVIDTPGMYSIHPITEEERVAREILLHETPDVVIHVLDARNLERMLAMTIQLIEAGLPVILVVNIMDEAERMGLSIDLPLLQEKLGIPVIGAATARKRGLDEIRSGHGCIPMHCEHSRFGYSRRLEHDISRGGRPDERGLHPFPPSPGPAAAAAGRGDHRTGRGSARVTAMQPWPRRCARSPSSGANRSIWTFPWSARRSSGRLMNGVFVRTGKAGGDARPSVSRAWRCSP